ncbi:prepilin-type N-terminal cleavage/methylation domain-containing protein [Desulforhopalus singaporensis]|uniref:Type IV pilus assembly protein PilV n=1 Tax=Desulforhopalus singaporensis TaxID=91360 RepID=A0A1H0QPC8_9BACT|nr:prepilin-type N-terminal cleavage/methylation domain-containing protein [Desulforhopalus singaporensis]SDP19233.1 type IV pilus assembly protein PilV [Desulforhopalus singaporensis]
MNIKEQDGFTLIEVVVALGVLAFGILGMIVMQYSGTKGNMTADTITTAAMLASDQIEQIFRLDYDDAIITDTSGGNVTVALAGLDDTDSPAADYSTTTTVAGGTYNLYVNTAENYPMPDTKTIRVIVSRLERGTIRNVTYNYIKAKRIEN